MNEAEIKQLQTLYEGLVRRNIKVIDTVSADASGTSQGWHCCPHCRPQSPATDHRLPTTQKYIVHDINPFFTHSSPEFPFSAAPLS